jgi:hypothetical protein
MDIHKPKPVHGWKELLSEIGVVVIGISIALSAEAVIERLYWRDQVRITRDTLAQDFASKLGMAAEREAFSACINERLNRWGEMIDEGARTGRFPPQGAMHRAPRRLWQLSSWQGLSSAQVATHLKREDLVVLSTLANYLQLAQDEDQDEDVQWTRLYTLVGPGRAVEPGELADLRMALSRARGDAKSLRLAALQITGYVERGTLAPADKIKEAKAIYLSGSNHARCLPDEPVPAHYGDGPPAGQPLDRPLRSR